MIKNTQSETNYPILLGSATVLMGLGYLVYKNYNKDKQQSNIPLDLIMKVLKEYKKQFYPVFKDIRIMSRNMQNQYCMMRQTTNIQKEDLDEISKMITMSPQFQTMVQEVEDIVYQKFDINNRKEFENSVLQVESQNKEVKKLNDSIKNAFSLSLIGEPEMLDIKFPEEITSNFVFEVKKNLTKSELDEFVKFCVEYETQFGKINPQDPQFMVGIEKSFKAGNKNFNYPECFSFSDENLPSTILSQAIFRFSDSDTGFREKITQLQRMKEQLLRKSVYQFQLNTILEDINKISKMEYLVNKDTLLNQDNNQQQEVLAQQNVENQVQEGVEKVKENVEQVQENVENQVQENVEQVQENVEQVQDVVEQEQENVENQVQDVVEQVQETVEQVQEEVKNKVQDTVEQLQDTVEQVQEQIEEKKEQLDEN